MTLYGNFEVTIRQTKYSERQIKQFNPAKILVLDGAMGTMIQKYRLQENDYRGEMFKDHPKSQKGNNDLLCLTKPEVIRNIHRNI